MRIFDDDNYNYVQLSEDVLGLCFDSSSMSAIVCEGVMQ